MSDNVINLPVPSPETGDERVRAEAHRQKHLFDWADAVLVQIGLTKAVNAANTMLELIAITFDPNSAEVVMAIQNALHPASGKKEAHFAGLKEPQLKQLLRARFINLKDERKKKLRSGRQQLEDDWTEELILNKEGNVVAPMSLTSS